jgi:threonine/homoserine/homoserine lactone efflux protein
MDVAGFALAVLLFELTPGPNMAWLAGLAATEGRRHGMAAVAGIAVGLIGNGLLAALGLAALLQAAPDLSVALRLVGAAVLALLAVMTWREADQPARASTAPQASMRSFGAGLILNLINPKAYVVFLVIAPQFIAGTALSVRDGLILTFISAAIATLIHIGIVLAGARAHAWVQDPARTKWVKRSFAVIMLGIAILFALADLRLS